MKQFTVSMPFTGVAVRTIEAETEEDAITKFLDESTFPINIQTKGDDAEITEINFCEKIVGVNTTPMRVEELRVGNIIGSKTFEQWEVRPSDIEQIFENKDPEQYFGIPLNTQWLTRMGFVKYDECFWRIHKSEGWFLNNAGELTKSFSEFFVRVQYVHQLQNLCFALGGEELTIK